MNRIYVKGEVSNCKYHTSGHIYFTLKDGTGALNGVLFAKNRKGLAFSMKNGDNVIALGSISVYERDGKYQLYAREILPDGEGLLYQRFERLKRELEEMGMFAQEYKQPIPKYIRTLGIVTAPTGAAIRDIQNISRRRNPYVQTILFPALVQGEGAAASIANGIRALDHLGVDVIILGRGGGSMEDLWAFNEEIVARAIFECQTPTISAVGHETDTTIADFVADLRAPTPSAAAELAVYDIHGLESSLLSLQLELSRRITEKLERSRELALQYGSRLQLLSPESQVNEKRQTAADLEEKLHIRMESCLTREKHRMELYAQRLEAVSPVRKLSQGYAFVSDEKGRAVCSTEDVAPGGLLGIYMLDGKIAAEVKEVAQTEREAWNRYWRTEMKNEEKWR